MDRRAFVKTAGAALVMPFIGSAEQGKVQEPRVMTATGEVAAVELGTMLPHEHVCS